MTDNMLQQTLTIGQVLDTNDPQQMGRLRASCPGWGDSEEKEVGDIPWATYVSPFAGSSNNIQRGTDESVANGSAAYGFWGIPKVGAYVLVGCIDGDTSLRFWIGCIQPQLMTHTLPHGRYLWNQDDLGIPDGPVDSSELPIQPLYDNMTEQFTNQTSLVSGTPSNPRKNMEWRTRGVDTQVSAITAAYIQSQESIESQIADHAYRQFTTITQENGEEFIVAGPGYAISHIEPNVTYKSTLYNYDSHIYSWTTPGFHSISMDDRYWNNRMRFRTTSGNQIILDDSNERIYISTAQGKTWVELDQVGNVDIHADRNVSVRAGGDINYSTDQTFRVKAKQGIHMHTDGDYRVTSENISFNVGSTLHFTSKETNINSGTGGINAQSGGRIAFDSTKVTSFNASEDFIVTGSTVQLNGPPAPTLNLDDAAEAYWTSRVPEHEPWARVFMSTKADQDSGNTWEPEYSYTDSMVGRGSEARGETYQRNPNWRR